MYKFAILAVGIAAGAVSAVVYQAKIRDSKWLADMKAKLARKAPEVIIVEK